MSSDVSTTAKPEVVKKPEHALITALKGLSEGVTSLVTNHLQLAKLELKSDAMEIGKDLVGIILAAILALLGYILLNVAAILFSAWFGGIFAVSICTLLLALVHLIGGALTLRALGVQFARRHYGFYSSHELQRSTKWAKTTTDPNPTTQKAPPRTQT